MLLNSQSLALHSCKFEVVSLSFCWSQGFSGEADLARFDGLSCKENLSYFFTAPDKNPILEKIHQPETLPAPLLP